MFLQSQPQATAAITPIDNWQDFLRDGEQFLNTAIGAVAKRKKSFTPDTIYNLTAMAIEKYIMATLMQHGQLAENHTMADLHRAIEPITGPLPRNLVKDMRFMDSFQEICDPDSYVRRDPSENDLDRILATGQAIRDLLVTHINTSGSKG